MKNEKFFWLVVVVFSLISCNSTSNVTKTLTPLSQNDWQLFSLNTQQVSIVQGGKIPQLSFDTQNMRVSGNGGCNSLSGSFKLGKENLSFGPLATTRMACPGDNIETNFLSALSKTEKFSMYNGKLVLNDSSGKQLMVFDPVKKE
ncbi:MAG: META domain-containing protein [Chitinophagales bacterium]